MRWLGRWMQIIALGLPPLAIVLELTQQMHHAFTLGHMLLLLVFAVVLFYTGRLIEAYGRGNGN